MKKWLLIFFLFFGLVALFHKSLLLGSCHLVLSSLGKGGICYQKMAWENEKIVISDLSFENEGQKITIERIDLTLSIDWKKFTFSPLIEVFHPEVILHDLQKGAPSLPFYCSSRVSPVIQITNGVLQLEGERFYFSLLKNLQKESLGTVLLSTDPEQEMTPLVKVDVFVREEGFSLEFEAKEPQLYRSLPLIQTWSGNKVVHDLAGSCEVEGSLLLGKNYNCKELTLHAELFQVVASFPSISLEEVAGRVDLFFLQEEKGKVELQVDLKGRVQEENIPFHVVSQGISSEKDLGFEGLLTIEHENAPFSLSRFRSLLQGDGTCHTNVQAEHWGVFEINYLLAQFTKNTRCVEGQVQGAFDLVHSFSEIESLQLSDVQMDDLQLYDESHKVFKCKSCALTGLFYPQQEEWLSELSLCGDEGEYIDPDRHFSQVGFQIHRDADGFLPSFISMDTDDLQITAAYLGAKEEFPWKIGVKGDIGPLLKQEYGLEDLLPSKGAIPLEIQVGLMKKGQGIYASSDGKIFSDDFVATFLLAWQECSFYDLLEGKFLIPSFQEGAIEFKHCNLSSYQELLQRLFGEIALGGTIEARVSFDLEKMDVQLAGEDLTARLSGISFAMPVLKSTTCVYDRKKSVFSYELPLQELSLESPSFHATLDALFKGSSARSPSGIFLSQGSFSHLSVPFVSGTLFHDGRIEWSHTPKEFLIAKASGKWQLVDGSELECDLKKLFWNLQEKGEFSFRLLEGRKEVALLEGAFQEKEGGWECSLNKERSHIQETLLQMESLFFSSQGIPSFEMRPLFAIERLPELYSFVSKMGFFPSGPFVDGFSSLGVQGKVRSRVLYKEGIFSVEALSSAITSQGKEALPFRFDARFSTSDWNIQMFALGSFAMRAEVMPKEEGRFVIPTFEGTWEKSVFKGKGDLQIDKDKWVCTIPSLQGDLPEGFLLGDIPLKGGVAASLQLVLDPLQKTVTGDTHFIAQMKTPFISTLSTPKKVSFLYDPNVGFSAQQIQLTFKEGESGSYLGEIGTKKLSFSKEGVFSCQGIELTLTPPCMHKVLETTPLQGAFAPFSFEGTMKVTGDLKWQKEGYGFQGGISPGWYGWKGHKLFLEQVQLLIDPQNFTIRTRTHLQEQPLWSSFQLKMGKELYGVLKVLDHPQAEGLAFAFRSGSKGAYIETVQGSACGLQVRLNRDEKKKVMGADRLVGEIFCDLQKLQLLLPKDLQGELAPLKLGSGYSFQGEILTFQGGTQPYAFRGHLQGKRDEGSFGRKS